MGKMARRKLTTVGSGLQLSSSAPRSGGTFAPHTFDLCNLLDDTIVQEEPLCLGDDKVGLPFRPKGSRKDTVSLTSWFGKEEKWTSFKRKRNYFQETALLALLGFHGVIKKFLRGLNETFFFRLPLVRDCLAEKQKDSSDFPTSTWYLHIFTDWLICVLMYVFFQ